jgi:hypothetical protein
MVALLGKKREPKGPSVVVWTSRKAGPDVVAKLVAVERGRMAKSGYTCEDVSYVEAGRSKRSWVALGVLSFARSKQIEAIVTFTKG